MSKSDGIKPTTLPTEQFTLIDDETGEQVGDDLTDESRDTFPQNDPVSPGGIRAGDRPFRSSFTKDGRTTPRLPGEHVKFFDRSQSAPHGGDEAGDDDEPDRRRAATGATGKRGPPNRKRIMSRQLSRQFSRTTSGMRHISERTFSVVDPDDENPERGTWSNQFEFFLSCLGYAVGLGNVWRFPYLCHRNGGGAFLIPYLLMLIFCGLPMLFLELSMGQYSSEGPISIWKMAPLFRGIGVGMVMISLFLATYYNMITGWAIYYLYESMTTVLPWTCCREPWAGPDCVAFATCPGQNLTTTAEPVTMGMGFNGTNVTVDKNITFAADDFFHQVTLVISGSVGKVGTVQLHLFLALTFAWIIVFLVLMKGIKSVGKIVYFTSLFPYAVLLILLIRAAVEPGALKGVIYYLTPKWEYLLEARVWGDALTQIFFSTSICTGGVITLASYNRFHNNVYRDAIIIGIGNSLTSIFSGFVVFSILGFMAHRQNAEVADIIAEGPGLTFIIYPQAVTLLPASPLWSGLFFLMLITLALSSMFPTVENVTTAIIDSFPDTLRPYKFWITAVTCGTLWLAGICMTTNGGIYILLLLDRFAVGYALVLVGLAEIIVFGWVYGAGNILKNIESMIGFRPSAYWFVLWRFVCPVLLVIALLTTWAMYTPLNYGTYIFPPWANALGWVLSFLPFSAIPITAAYVYATSDVHMVWTDGQSAGLARLKAKMGFLTRPESSWGPKLEQFRDDANKSDEDDNDVFEG